MYDYALTETGGGIFAEDFFDFLLVLVMNPSSWSSPSIFFESAFDSILTDADSLAGFASADLFATEGVDLTFFFSTEGADEAAEAAFAIEANDMVNLGG